MCQDEWNIWVSGGETFLFGLVLISGSDTSAENREQLANSDDNILDHHGLFCWGVSDSARPQLAQKVAALSNRERFGSIYTTGQVTGSPQMWRFVLIHPNVFWLWSKLLSDTVRLIAGAGNRCLHTLHCCSLDSSIHILTNGLRAQEWEKCRKKRRYWSMRSKVKYIRKSVDREVAFLRQALTSNSSGL